MTVPSPSSGPVPPAGWYGDPVHPSRQRWWDGRAWSNQVRLTAPLDAAAAAPPPQAPVPTMSTVHPVRSLNPYLMAPAGLNSAVGPKTADDVALASFARRFIATILDNLLVAFVASAVLPFVVDDFQNRAMAGIREWYAQLLTGQGTMSPELTHLVVLTTYAQIAATLVYGILSLSLWSRTLGQRITGIAVCPADKGKDRIGWRHAIPRTLMWTLLSQGGSFLVLVQMVSVSLVLWHPRRQTLPDLMARTQVVRR